MRLTHEWRDRLAEEQRAAQSDHFGAHPWGMHLGHGDHIGAPSGRHWAGYSLDEDQSEDLSGSARLIGVDPRGRRATFVSDHIGGWYAALAETGG